MKIGFKNELSCQLVTYRLPTLCYAFAGRRCFSDDGIGKVGRQRFVNEVYRQFKSALQLSAKFTGVSREFGFAAICSEW